MKTDTKKFFTLFCACFFSAMLCFCLSACTTIPATGQSRLDLISEAQMKEVGQKSVPDFLKTYGGLIQDKQLVSYVRTIGQKLAAVSERPKLEWHFYPVNSSVVNAFALPGGQIFITRGLLSKLNNEAQLAGVLGHEIGHICAEHIPQQMTHQLGINIGIALLGIIGQTSNSMWMQALGAGAQVGGGLYMLKFSREDETQADELGVRYMTKAGYNPEGQIQVMNALEKAAGSKSGGLEILQTHPLTSTRIDNLKELLKNKYPNYKNNKNYVFNAKAYQINVLDQLKKLPKPKTQTNS